MSALLACLFIIGIVLGLIAILLCTSTTGNDAHIRDEER